jgi:nucleotide-binding universal stress UspA family protein
MIDYEPMITHGEPFHSILVPYDGSAPAKAAIALACSVMTPAGTLTVLAVVDEAPLIAESATTVMAYDPTPLLAALDEEGTAFLADAVALCAIDGIVAHAALVHDLPVGGILAAAKERACDLIVMGTHGRSGISRVFLGSTTEGVLREAMVPVLVVRHTGT